MQVISTAAPFIECRQVTRDFQSADGVSFQALSTVDLEIFENEFVCLLGPSGCGKTTLLNMIAGFMPPTTGGLSIGTDQITGPGPDRGVVFQDYSLFGWLTVRENVEFGPRMNGVPAAERRQLSDHYLSLV
jgi:NitT/TauT family transport system ATP-binding protein